MSTFGTNTSYGSFTTLYDDENNSAVIRQTISIGQAVNQVTIMVNRIEHVIVTEGKVRVTISLGTLTEGKSFDLNCGQYIFVPRNYTMSLANIGDTHASIVRVRQYAQKEDKK